MFRRGEVCLEVGGVCLKRSVFEGESVFGKGECVWKWGECVWKWGECV